MEESLRHVIAEQPVSILHPTTCAYCRESHPTAQCPGKEGRSGCCDGMFNCCYVCTDCGDCCCHFPSSRDAATADHDCCNCDCGCGECGDCDCTSCECGDCVDCGDCTVM